MDKVEKLREGARTDLDWVKAECIQALEIGGLNAHDLESAITEAENLEHTLKALKRQAEIEGRIQD